MNSLQYTFLSNTFTQLYGVPASTVIKSLPANAGDMGSISGLGRSPRVGNGNPLQWSCLETSMDRGAWRAAVHGVAKSWTWLRDWTELSWAGNHASISLLSFIVSHSVTWCPEWQLVPQKGLDTDHVAWEVCFPQTCFIVRGRGHELAREQEGTNQRTRKEVLLPFQWLSPLLLSKQQKRF